MKKKILFISHWYPSDKSPNTGVFVKKHAEAIARNNEINVVHFDFAYSRNILKINLDKNNDEIEVYTIKVRSRFYKSLYYLLPLHLFLFGRLKGKFNLNVKEYNIIHSNVLFPNGIIGYYISKKYKLPQVHTEHWSKLNFFLTKSFYRFIGKKVLQKAKCLLPVSQLLESEIKTHTTNTNIKVIPNVIDSSNFSFKEKNKKTKIKFLAIAHWSKPKNPFLFLDALKQIYEEGLFSFELKIIGEGPQLEEIKNRNYNFDIIYEGYIPHFELQNYFHSVDYFVHGSDYETFSVVVVESLYTGTPVIASNVGIVKEIIDSSNGFVCENEYFSWYNNITKAVQTDYNHQKISSDISGKFDAAKISLEITKVYDSLLKV